MGLQTRQTRAIVFIYSGSEIKRETLCRIAKVLDKDVDTDSLDVRVMDCDDIAGAILHSTTKRSNFRQDDDEATAKDMALTYIANLFKEEMSNILLFKKALTINAITQQNNELTNALNILKDAKASDDDISAKVLNKYAIKPPHLRCIRAAAALIF